MGSPWPTAIYADSAVVALQAENPGVVADSDSDYGLALAYAGRRTEAIAAADGYLKLHPVDGDFVDGPDNAESSVKAYVRVGATDKALDLLERLLRIPGRLTPGRLRIDPSFAPLRDNPRFQRLIASKAAGE